MNPRPTSRLIAILAAVLLQAAACSQPAPAAPAQSAPAPARDVLVEPAIEIIGLAANGDDAALRSNAIEAIAVLPERAAPYVTRGLGDPNPGVRFAALVTAGRLGFSQLAGQVRGLTRDEHPHVRAAALFALARFGERVDLTPLARMLVDRDPRLRANVAMLLGLLGDKTAVPMLKDAARTPMHRNVGADQAAVVKIQIAEAIVRLDETEVTDALRAGAFSPYGEVQVLAINAMGAVGDAKMEPSLERFLAEPPLEVQLAAAGALARLGNRSGMSLATSLAGDVNPVVRAQAAWVLGWFPPDAGIDPTILQRLMSDPVMQVRVAAAASALRRAAAHR